MVHNVSPDLFAHRFERNLPALPKLGQNDQPEHGKDQETGQDGSAGEVLTFEDQGSNRLANRS
jgi:hypothetical protein